MDGEIVLSGGGRLCIREEGTQIRFEASRSNDERGLYKVWISGGGGRMLLGTLAPEQGRLYLCRRMFLSTLQREGCWPVTEGECVLAFSFGGGGEWGRENSPERLLGDEGLRCAVRGRTVRLCRRHGGFCLAEPFDPSRPFPVAPLFCLAKVGQVDGRPHIIYTFDRDGNPVVPHNGEEIGENSGVS